MAIVHVLAGYAGLFGCIGLMLAAPVWVLAGVWRDRQVPIATARGATSVWTQQAGRRLVMRAAIAAAAIVGSASLLA